MQKTTILLMLSLFLVAGCSINSEASKENKKSVATIPVKAEKSSSEDQPLLDYLPEGLSNADVMEMGMEPGFAYKVMTISNKMQESLQEKKDWFLTYVAERPEGEVLPYHPNFGITEEEYGVILDSDNHMKLLKKGNTSVLITRKGDKLILAADQSEVVKTITFDLKNNTVATNFGELTYKGKVEASENQKVTGKWSGESWELTEGDIVDLEDIKTMDENTYIKTVKLHVGKMEATGYTLVYLDYGEISNGERVKAEEFLFLK